MRVRLQGIKISVNGRRERCEVELATAGAYTITATTVLVEPAVLLVSSYLVDLDGNAAATHLWRGGAREFGRDEVNLAGVTYGRACLLDHAAQLHDRLVAELCAGAGTGTVVVTVSDEALVAAERLWSNPEAV